MNYLESIISEDFESHEVANIFTNASPSTTAFLAHGWKGCIIHMVVDWFIEFETEQGADVIGCARV